ncbi:hypothetical protein BPAE_0147g00200 [Botrytis paeoniae]|uniref:Uncharacterized protein n=1 Tax=Botrytis paeoniae TaxID=278948 RepID=A0A4Z1FEI3_9HELO|nr:hypothetical protein BPAE_0147g00200 [Botrytis paeoniae]
MIRENIEDMMNQGRAFFEEERYVKAIRLWNKCQRLIFSQCSGKRGERLLKGLPLESLNNLAYILFQLARMRAEITSYLMQTKWKGNHEKVVMEATSMVKAGDLKAEVTYTYDTDQIGKMRYGESIAYRLSGHLDLARNAMKIALEQIPDDSEFLIEEGKVSLAISEEARRNLINNNVMLSLRRREMN